jgi:hypothetical protein
VRGKSSKRAGAVAFNTITETKYPIAEESLCLIKRSSHFPDVFLKNLPKEKATKRISIFQNFTPILD